MNAGADPVAERRREWVNAVNDQALERYVDLVADDVVWLPPSGEPLRSRQAFRSWLEPFFRRYAYRFSVEPLEVRAFEHWCAEIGRFRSVLSAEGSGAPQEHNGHYFVLWKRDADEVWRIERYVDGVGRTSSRSDNT